jgi:CheY-like chemotaxis protein
MPPTLLLADTSPAIHRVVELTFAGQPIEVVAVRDGAAAVARLETAPPDIILADVAMPAPTGYEIAAHVKRTPHLAAIPVVLLTGAFEPVDEARAQASGCAGVLAKPFDPEIVVRRVNELLRRGEGESPAAPSVEPEADDDDSRPLPTTSALVVGEKERAPRVEPREDQGSYFERLDKSLTALRAPAVPPPGERPAPPASTIPAPARSVVSAPAGAESKPPSLAEAFAALMEAERWSLRERTRSAADRSAAPIDTGGVDEVVQAIAHAARQLVEQGGRDAVRDIVSQVAERLIREEIARIKAEVENDPR